MSDVSTRFAQRAVHHLRDEYLPRIAAALEALPQDALWWRPHAGANSVGNLLLHLDGNVRQWILSGLGEEADERRRSQEFEANAGGDASALLAALTDTVRRACGIIEATEAVNLLKKRRIQGFEVDGLEAIFHVVEHFSWHVGQIVYMAKLLAGEQHRLRFYDDLDLEQTNPR